MCVRGPRIGYVHAISIGGDSPVLIRHVTLGDAPLAVRNAAAG